MTKQASTYLIKNCTIFDGVSDTLLSDHFILIEGEEITYLGADKPDVSDAVATLDLAGSFVMPGLIDAHFHAYAVHADFAYVESLPISYVAHESRHLLENALSRGFTTVRDAGGADHGLWWAAEKGLFKSPRIFFSGRALSQTGGHGDPRKPYEEPCACATLNGNLTEVVDGADEVRKVVREALRQGAHQIKIFVSGGIISPSDPIWMLQFSEDEILAAVDEANRRQSYVMAHAYTGESIERAVRCGVRSIEHANLITRQAAQAVAEHNAFVVPTLVAYHALESHGAEAGASKKTLEKLQEIKSEGLRAIELCREYGVELGFGTDLLGDLHPQQLRELLLRAETDSSIDVLRSATSVNAKLMGQSDKIGIIKEGAFADLLILDGNPIDNLDHLYNNGQGASVVIKGGEIVKGANTLKIEGNLY